MRNQCLRCIRFRSIPHMLTQRRTLVFGLYVDGDFAQTPMYGSYIPVYRHSPLSWHWKHSIFWAQCLKSKAQQYIAQKQPMVDYNRRPAKRVSLELDTSNKTDKSMYDMRHAISMQRFMHRNVIAAVSSIVGSSFGSPREHGQVHMGGHSLLSLLSATVLLSGFVSAGTSD